MSPIEEIFNRLKANAPVIARTSAAERIEKLRRMYRAAYDLRDEIEAAGYEELGMNGKAALIPLKTEINYIADHLESWMKDEIVAPVPALMGRKAYIHYEPKGMVLHLATWNAPVLISLSPAASAIAAGNAVVIKPSEIAPKAAAIVARIIRQSFPDNEVAVVTGGPETAQELLSLPFNHISYVGNNRIGRLVMKAAAEHFAGVTLEMGGKNPAIVDETADVADAARKISATRLRLAGQVCLSPDYALVHRSKFDEFVRIAGAHMTAMFNPEGDGFEKSPDLPRIVNVGHVRRIRGLIDDALAKGATLAFGGTFDEATRFMAPTILTGITDAMAIAQEETFGPVLCVMPFDTREGAIREIEKRPKPLGLYIFGTDRAAVDYFLDNTRAGSSAINNAVVQANIATLPFGGCNHSGIGRLGGHAGFVEFSNPRSVVEDPLDPAQGAPGTYPPYPPQMRTYVETLLAP